MISGYWGLSLNILSIFFVSLCASLIFISLAFYFLSGSLNRFHASAKLRILWGAVVIPWVISLVCVALLTVPELMLSRDMWFSAFVHWHHIYHFEICSWHGASIGVFSVIFFSVCLTKIVKAIKTNTHLNQLDFFVQNNRNEQGLTVIESDACEAFTSGFFRPRSYMTSGLRDQLSSHEAGLVLEHELAHASAHDPLRKYCFSLFAAFFPAFIGQQLNEAFSLALEQIADAKTVSTKNDETTISGVLLKVSKLRQQYSNTSLSSVSCHFSTDPLALRIRYLLSENKGRPFPIVLFSLFAVAAAMLSTLSVDLLHHALEKLFIH